MKLKEIGKKRYLKNSRVIVGKDNVVEPDLPDLVNIQLNSYEWFLQRETKKSNLEINVQGLEEIFRSTFPIENASGNISLEYQEYILDEENVKVNERESKEKGLTFAIPLKAIINLRFHDTGEIRQKEIYMGDIPLMTNRGTFIINGVERVVVSQIHRSPGVIFTYDEKTGVFSSRIIPYRGSWLEFELDTKKELLYVRIDRKRKILATTYLRVLGYETREQIIPLFYNTKTINIENKDEQEKVSGCISAKDIFITHEAEFKEKILQAGTKITPIDIDKLYQAGIQEIEIIDFEDLESIHSDIVINTFEKEDFSPTKDDLYKDEPDKEDAIVRVYSILRPGEPTTLESAEKDIISMFFSDRRYDLGDVGRYKLNKRLGFDGKEDKLQLTPIDIVNTLKYLIKVYIGEGVIDDIDHLGNRRIRSVGELITNQLKVAFSRMERLAKERMQLKEAETSRPQDLISIKPITVAIKEFFGSSQLSQFMEQINPLSELTHKRRLNALGPGGLSRERAGFEVRDVHYTHYGRMCPIETPEGPNIGLIVSLCVYSAVNQYGFIETPYRRVMDGVVQDEVDFLSAMDEEKYFIAQANAKVDQNGNLVEENISVRYHGDYRAKNAKEVQYIDVSPKQIISVSTTLVPFLEHDDANRALMGSNMQRQAVPLMKPESPLVGTGMEEITAYDSGAVITAREKGVVRYVTSKEIHIEHDGIIDEYYMAKYWRSNQDTCYNQKPIVNAGQMIEKGEVIADGPAVEDGELALGTNLLVAFMPWYGFNFEDAILVSEKVVREDKFTSIHIKEFSMEVRETKLGPEKITREIPNASDSVLAHLDEEGVVRVGATVKSGDVVVGKVTPKSETESTPEFKLLNSIFGEKAKEVRDSSLRLPHGVFGIVIDIKRLSRENGDELEPGVEEMIKVFIGTKRKLQVGDKLAGRHGNKGIIAAILPDEDMPFLPDGTPVDIVLNPLGVPSRMNLGQIMETELGWAAHKLGKKFGTPVFNSLPDSEISKLLKQAGLPENSKVGLYDGRTGVRFEEDVFVGYIYMLKLNHLVDDKMHARSTGPYSLVTQQPLGGKAQFGGQRLGEMEVWALEAYGAANTLQELLTIKSDDMVGRAKIYENIVKGEHSSMPGIPESFNVLVQELRGLGLDLVIYDSKGKMIALTERDEEMYSQIISKF